MSRCIVIGDIHGCVEEFDQLLKKVAYNKGNDRLVLLGDLIDRGPDPAGVVRLAREIGAESVMGNHEEKALRWRRHEAKRSADPTYYKNPMSDIAQARIEQWNKIAVEDWDWLAKLPYFIHINDSWTAVHAGCMPNVEVEEQKSNELMRLRYVKEVIQPSGYSKFKMASLNEMGDIPDGSTDYAHWTELWTGPRSIVYGHYTYSEVKWTAKDGVETVGIDTGCVHGGDLTAWVKYLPPIYQGMGVSLTSELVSVKANKVYAERKPWNESTE